MKKGKDAQVRKIVEEGQKPPGRVDGEDLLPGTEKMTPEEEKEYLDDLFRGYIFGKG